MPKYVDNRARVNGMRSGVREREVGANRGKDGELNYQERVAVIWIEKVKSVGPRTLDGVERGSGCAQDRVILADMSNIGMFKKVDKAASNPPVIVISVTNWHFSRSFHFYFNALTLVVIVQSLAQTRTYIP